jgi:hypothetical protein
MALREVSWTQLDHNAKTEIAAQAGGTQLLLIFRSMTAGRLGQNVMRLSAKQAAMGARFCGLGISFDAKAKLTTDGSARF